MENKRKQSIVLQSILEIPYQSIRGEHKSHKGHTQRTTSQQGIDYYKSIKIQQLANSKNQIKSLKRFQQERLTTMLETQVEKSLMDTIKNKLNLRLPQIVTQRRLDNSISSHDIKQFKKKRRAIRKKNKSEFNLENIKTSHFPKSYNSLGFTTVSQIHEDQTKSPMSSFLQKSNQLMDSSCIKREDLKNFKKYNLHQTNLNKNHSQPLLYTQEISSIIKIDDSKDMKFQQPFLEKVQLLGGNSNQQVGNNNIRKSEQSQQYGMINIGKVKQFGFEELTREIPLYERVDIQQILYQQLMGDKKQKKIFKI